MVLCSFGFIVKKFFSLRVSELEVEVTLIPSASAAPATESAADCESV